MRLLFQMETTGDWTDAARDRFLEEPALGFSPEKEEDGLDLPYFFTVFEAVRAHLEEIDGVLSKHSDKWTVRRMASVDRAILRLACAEILWVDQIAPKISVNEAVELAKAYGSAKSPSFVNGVLAGVLQASDIAGSKTDPAGPGKS